MHIWGNEQRFGGSLLAVAYGSSASDAALWDGRNSSGTQRAVGQTNVAINCYEM